MELLLPDTNPVTKRTKKNSQRSPPGSEAPKVVAGERYSGRNSPLDSNVEHCIIDEIIKSSKLDAAIIYPHLRATSELRSQHPESERMDKAASKNSISPFRNNSKAAIETRESPQSKLSKKSLMNEKHPPRQVMDRVFKKTASVANARKLNQDMADGSGLLATEGTAAEENTELGERRSDAPSMRRETVEIRQITKKSKEHETTVDPTNAEAGEVKEDEEPLVELDPKFLLTELYNHNMKDILGFTNMQKRTLTHLESILKYQGVIENDADLQKMINKIQVTKPRVRHHRQLNSTNSKVFGINSHKKKVMFNSHAKNSSPILKAEGVSSTLNDQGRMGPESMRVFEKNFKAKTKYLRISPRATGAVKKEAATQLRAGRGTK